MILVSAVSFTGTWDSTFKTYNTLPTNFQYGLQQVNKQKKRERETERETERAQKERER
jgi:hypothetical protein